MHQARIESNPAVMMGKPVIAGTRITVEGILERLGHGESMASPFIPALTGRWLKSSFQPKGYAAFPHLHTF